MRALLLSTLLASGPPASSSVEIDTAGLEQHMGEEALHRFHGDLILRLLEAGHVVGPGGQLRLSLRSAGGEVVVECRGGAHPHQAEVDDTDAAILGLELVHRAVDLVGLCAAELDPARPTAVTDEAMVLDADGLAAAELSALAHGLIEEQVQLVGDEGLAGARLCAVGSRVADGVFVVEVGHDCAAGSTEVDADPRAAVERWRARSTEPKAPEPEAPEPAADEREPAPRPASSPASPTRARSWGVSAGVGLGVELRVPGSGPDLRLDLAGLHRSGLFVGALAQLAPSRAGELAVLDSAVLASAGWRALLSERVILRPSVGLGLAIHRFAFPDEPVGHRLDLGLRVPLELDLRLTARLELGLALAASVATRRIVHRVEGEPSWTRGYLRLEALVGLRYDWLPPAPG